MLIHDGIVELFDTPPHGATVFLMMAVASGLLLLAGLWTPIAGILIVIAELAAIFYGTTHLRSANLLATVGVVLIMLGPGVRSIDALLFGRKRIDIHERPSPR